MPRAKTPEQSGEEKQAERGNCGAICFNLEYRLRVVAHASVQSHFARNIARLKRQKRREARKRERERGGKLFPPPHIRRINLYVAWRNQAKEAHPKRALRRAAFSVSGPVYAPIGMKLRGVEALLYTYTSLGFRDVFRQGARDASRSRNERDGRYGHVGRKWQGDGRESKSRKW